MAGMETARQFQLVVAATAKLGIGKAGEISPYSCLYVVAPFDIWHDVIPFAKLQQLVSTLHHMNCS